MKTLPLALAAILIAIPLHAQDKTNPPTEKVSIVMVSGETMVGKVAGIKDGSLSLITDYGAVRIPVEKISPESQQKLNIPKVDEVTKLKNRIVELEALVESLREENSKLRKSGQGTPVAERTTPPASKETAKPAPPESGALTYRLSSTNKRHNSRCRYFKSAGNKDCSPTDGTPCKVCGG